MAQRGVNKVIIVGNLGQDPEVRYMDNGGAVANLSVATSETWRDKNTGEPREKTEWHRVVMFGKLAEVAGEYLRKGSQVYLEGQLQTRKWQDQQGQDRYTTEIVVQGFNGVMQMLGGRQDNQGQQGQQGQPSAHQQTQAHQTPPGGGQGGGTWGKPQQPRQQQQRQQRQQQPATRYDEPPMDFDDDIPFAPLGLQYGKNSLLCMG